MTTILAIDPAAETPTSDTGWALALFSETEPFELLNSGVIHGGFEGFCRIHNELLEIRLLMSEVGLDPDRVVVENYIPYNSLGDSSPRLIEGVVRFLRPDAVLQPSSVLSEKGLVPDSLLKAMGLWSTLGHHNDEVSAIKHALHYVLASRHKPTLKAIRNLDY